MTHQPQPGNRARALTLLEAAEFMRDAHFRDGLTVQEITTALAHTVDRADAMVGSLSRDGFGAEEIAEMLSAEPAAVSAAVAPPTQAVLRDFLWRLEQSAGDAAAEKFLDDNPDLRRMADETATRSDVGTEFARQADQPDEAGLAAWEGSLTDETATQTPAPRRGDAFEQWLKARRDEWAPEGCQPWQILDQTLEEYRLHADTGTPLGEHVCEGKAVGDCECLEQPTAGARQDETATETPAAEPTAEDIAREHVTSLHLIGEQLATIEGWFWEHLADVRDAGARWDETPQPSLRERHRAAWRALTPDQQAARLAELDAIDEPAAGARQDGTET